MTADPSDPSQMAARLPRAILDTNVFVGAGFRRQSASGRLIDAVRQGRLAMVWCPATQAETRHVLTKIPPLSWDSVADLFRPGHRADDPDPGLAGFVTDREDRKFAALSLATGVPVITSDDDLLRHAGRLDVWTPGAFAARIMLTGQDRP